MIVIQRKEEGESVFTDLTQDTFYVEHQTVRQNGSHSVETFATEVGLKQCLPWRVCAWCLLCVCLVLAVFVLGACTNTHTAGGNASATCLKMHVMRFADVQ